MPVTLSFIFKLKISQFNFCVCFCIDRKHYEQKIVAQNQSLINIAYIQSHEYRGPLTSIISMMNPIKEEDYLPPVEYLQLLESAINKLDEKIQDIVKQVNNNNDETNNKIELF